MAGAGGSACRQASCAARAAVRRSCKLRLVLEGPCVLRASEKASRLAGEPEAKVVSPAVLKVNKDALQRGEAVVLSSLFTKQKSDAARLLGGVGW